MEEFKSSNVVTDVDSVDAVTMNDILEQGGAPTAGYKSTANLPVVNDTSEIQRFLSREVSVATFNWTVGGVVFQRFDPWSLFLSKPAVVDKLKYFSRLKGNLRVRLNISGTPFHFGMAMLTYRPHPGLGAQDDRIYNFAVGTESTSAAENLKVVESQLLGVKFQPAYDTSVELMLPYVHFRPGIEVSSGSYSDIGTLSVIGLTALSHANGGTDPVSVEVLVSMEDVVLDVPTAVSLGFSLDDAVSKAAAFFAAGAKATRIASEYVPAVTSAMAMIGLSRPASREQTMNVKTLPFQMANYDLPDTVERLALSADSEMTISGQDVGDGAEDSLDVKAIASRPSYIATSLWSTSDARGTFKLGSVVTPAQTVVSTYTKATISPVAFGGQAYCCQTPVSFASSVFTHCRYDMVYRFTVVASPYHKGRLRIWYDPMPHAFASPELNLTNSVVINLAESPSAEVLVPWQNVRDSVRTGSPFVRNSFNDAGTFDVRVAGATTDACNGIIVCEVLNPLTAPVNGSNVSILMEVWAQDFVGYGPHVPRGIHRQPTTIDGDAIPYTPLGFDPSGGDAVVSLRQLMKRYTQVYGSAAYSASNAGQMREVDYLAPIIMPPPGMLNSSESLDVTPESLGVNYTTWSFRSYLAQAFALQRGSVRWKVSVQRRNGASTGSAGMSLSRFWDQRPAFGGSRRSSRAVLGSSIATPELVSGASSFQTTAARGDEGTQINSAQGTDFLDVEFPFVSGYRAVSARATMADDCGDTAEYMNALLTITSAPSSGADNYALFRLFEAVGEDYNVFYFMHAPALLQGYPAPV